ncbi:MAG TPA: response regulator transcription factor [Fimbriimonadaceae bacterium]|nr:response regulator transcription factor [Fimbriimonadaceae bacterium]
MNILLVEDERPLALAVTRLLKQSGWNPLWTTDGEKGFAAAKTGDFDVIILDVLLPNKNGWDVLAGLRAAQVNTPVLMLTAMDEVGDRVKGLNLGADDYLPKPFETTELVARVNALLRRDKVHKGDVIRIADLVIEREARKVTRGGQEIHLTRREYDLLEALAANEGRVLSREVIQSRVWSDEEAFSNTVDVFIGTLRKKVDAPFGTKLIHTAVGFGYVLRREAG